MRGRVSESTNGLPRSSSARSSNHTRLPTASIQRASIEAMLALAGEGGAPRMRASALSAMARFESQRGRIDEGVVLAEQAIAIAAAIGAESVEVDARYVLAHGLARLGRVRRSASSGLGTARERRRRAVPRSGGRARCRSKWRSRVPGRTRRRRSGRRLRFSKSPVRPAIRNWRSHPLMQLAWTSQPTLDAALVRKRYA